MEARQFRPPGSEYAQVQDSFPFFNGLRIDTESAAPRSQNIFPLYRTLAGKDRFAGLIAFTGKSIAVVGFSPSDGHAVIVDLNNRGEARTLSPLGSTLAWRLSKDIFHAVGRRMPSYELEDLRTVLEKAAKDIDSQVNGKDVVDYVTNAIDILGKPNEFLHDEVSVQFAQGLQMLVNNAKADFQWMFARFRLRRVLNKFVTNHPLTPRIHQDAATLGDQRLSTFGSYDVLNQRMQRQRSRRAARAQTTQGQELASENVSSERGEQPASNPRRRSQPTRPLMLRYPAPIDEHPDMQITDEAREVQEITQQLLSQMEDRLSGVGLDQKVVRGHTLRLITERDYRNAGDEQTRAMAIKWIDIRPLKNNGFRITFVTPTNTYHIERPAAKKSNAISPDFKFIISANKGTNNKGQEVDIEDNSTRQTVIGLLNNISERVKNGPYKDKEDFSDVLSLRPHEWMF